MTYNLLVQHNPVRPLLILTLALLVFFHTAYATDPGSKQPKKQTRATAHTLLSNPTDSEEVISVFSSLPLDNFRTWLTAELPLPAPIDDIAFAQASSTSADQYCYRSQNLRTVATASTPDTQTLQP